MRIVWAGAAVALAAVAGVPGLFGSAGRIDPDIDPVTVSAIAPARDDDRFYRLQVGGHEGGCVVEASVAVGAEKRHLSIDPACADIVPGLAQARWWLERADGSVAFATDDGRVAAEFAVADGAAFESYAPREPIMTLLAR